jgi:hypothetical protein
MRERIMKMARELATLTGLVMLAALAPAPAHAGSADATAERRCFSWESNGNGKIDRLLVELFRETVNPGETPVTWAAVYAEQASPRLSGFNVDGCGSDPDDPSHMICGFSCDGGRLDVWTTPDGLRVTPDGLVLRSCGLGGESFMLSAADMGGGAELHEIAGETCRNTMIPFEKEIEAEELGIN